MGWRSRASDNASPASTSLRTLMSVSRSGLDSVCCSSTYRARRIVTPEVIIVASWRLNTASSRSFTRCMNSRLISLDLPLESMSRTIKPRALSWSVTACLESASTSPRDETPARSIALNT